MQVYRRGKRFKGPGFSIIVLTNDRDVNRIGISVHRLIRGTVRRNRIKRIIREVFRLHRDLFPQGSDIVVTVAPDFRCATTPSVLTAFRSLLVPERIVSV